MEFRTGSRVYASREKSGLMKEPADATDQHKDRAGRIEVTTRFAAARLLLHLSGHLARRLLQLKGGIEIGVGACPPSRTRSKSLFG
jgi:hypothetical protein